VFILADRGDPYTFRVIALNLGCWTPTEDFHGDGGVAHNLATLEECHTVCISDDTCVAVDWEPSYAGKTCWILTSTAIKETTQDGVITHYELNRTCLRESFTFTPHSLLSYATSLYLLKRDIRQFLDPKA